MASIQTKFIFKVSILAMAFTLALPLQRSHAISFGPAKKNGFNQTEKTQNFENSKSSTDHKNDENQTVSSAKISLNSANAENLKNSNNAQQNGQLALKKLVPILTKEHLLYITKSIDPAGLPVVLGLPLKGALDCDKMQFSALEQVVSLGYLQDHALDLMIFAHWETRKLHKLYQLRTVHLLKQWNRQADEDLINYLETQNDPQKSSIEVYQKGRVSLAKHFHLSGKAVEQKLKTLINLAPSCLSAVNLSFPEKVRTAVTEDRAQKIAMWLTQNRTHLNELIKESHSGRMISSAPKTKQNLLNHLPVDLRLDGYGNAFDVKIQDESLILTSRGRLMDSKSDDTIFNFKL